MNIKIVHLLLNEEVNTERQIKSIESISKLSKFDNIEYIQIWNNFWKDDIPPGFYGNIENVRHSYYGNYTSFKNSFINYFTDDVDIFIQVEGDAILEYPADYIYNKILESVDTINIYNIDILSFGSLFHLENGIRQSNVKLKIKDLNMVDKIIGAQFLLFPRRIRDYVIDQYNNNPNWTAIDIYYNIIFTNRNMALYDKMYVKQCDGNSSIDNYYKRHLNNYDYIEIGTSDFDTIVGEYPDYLKGLSIDPIKPYLDNLPIVENNTKINIAISNEDSIVDTFYVEPNDIVEHNIDEWAKGCSAINKPHPNLKRYLEERNLLDILKSNQIERKSFETFSSENMINNVEYLKIDTEGHDPFIISSLLKTTIRPKKITFEANSLLSENTITETVKNLEKNGYTFTKRTENDIIVFYDTDKEIIKKPVLIFSTSKRLEYFKRTLKSLIKFNPNISNEVEMVYLLDHESSVLDRNYMEESLNLLFNGNYQMITFNKPEKLSFIDKFNFIKKVTNIDDIILFLEDDWECNSNIRLYKHIKTLLEYDYTQISFTDPFWIQEKTIKKEYFIDFEYWKNPYPNSFKHPIKWQGDVCNWVMGSINNYTNNPSLIKAEVFHNNSFDYDKNFEYLFSLKSNGKHIFTIEESFRHIGENSLIDKL